MRKLTPIDKMSKKSRKAYHAQQRGSWNGISPVTRIVPNKKAYDRNKARQASRRDRDAGASLAPILQKRSSSASALTEPLGAVYNSIQYASPFS